MTMNAAYTPEMTLTHFIRKEKREEELLPAFKIVSMHTTND